MADSQDRIASAIEASREELLDLGLRNPLLNYRPSRARGVEVVDELPEEIFRILVRESKSMTFKAAPESSDSEGEEHEHLTQPGDENEDGAPAARHVDLQLQTNFVSATLQARLRKTEHDARLFIEEQGVNTLYLALGMLLWFESDSSRELRRAPLVLVPVSLERSSVDIDKGFLRKTARLVAEHTTTPVIRPPESDYELTPQALKGLAEKDQPETFKVFNMLIAIRKLVEEKVDQMPYLLSIGERAEAIAEAFEQHLSDARKALLELTGVVEELERAEEMRQASDLPDEAFAAHFFLEGRGIEGAEKIARESAEAFEDNPHWKESDEQERRVRIALYKALAGSGTKDMVGVVDGLLGLLRRASS